MNDGTYKVMDQNGQWIITINKRVARAVGIKPTDRIEEIITDNKGEILLKKVKKNG